MADTKSPMMRQYDEAKAAVGDALLLFRMGDFYELFHEDAEVAARTLGLALTSRDKGESPIPMAGFPHHQLDGYVAKLIAAGIRVAVCDQVENPKEAKGLVRREVTRIVTAGTVTEESILDPRRSNYLAAIASGDPVGLAWVELSTGRLEATVLEVDRLADQLARLSPSECLLAEGTSPPALDDDLAVQWTKRPDWAFFHAEACKILCRHFRTTTLEGFGFSESSAQDRPALCAAGAVLEYLHETQKHSLEHIDRIEPYVVGRAMQIDVASRRSLEIARTMGQGQREGSLLWVLDRCVTAMGSRLLHEWVASPLTNRAEIDRRLDAVSELVEASSLAQQLRETLESVYDVPRLLGRVTTGRCSPRDLSQLGRTLRQLPALKAKLTARKSAFLVDLEGELALCPDLRSRLDAALADDCPLTSTEGGFIREGYDAELDQLRSLAHGGKQWIASYQAREAERTGIPNLKVGYNRVFGYYIEVTHAHREKIPADYHRKQTLKNAERFITPELKEHEEKVLSADERSCALEYRIFQQLRAEVVAVRPQLTKTARILATVDVIASLALLARDRRYCRPEMDEAPVHEIHDGRHPVLDLTEPEGTFVPNDAFIGGEAGSLRIVTGPNMAGKSTYIRQIALITLMAQIGSFVPARAARLGVVDRIFARVGAGDELARGRSTFMVEMTETARILNTATRQSLVVLDEIGRGTSTYDGISLAWAVVEYLHDRIGCRTVFATHYHELTDLSELLEGVSNLNVAVREWQDEVAFLHKIVDGAADKSYGIHVARLAGVPRRVIDRAGEILRRLEQEHVDQEGRPRISLRADEPHRPREVQFSLFGPEHHPLLEEIRELDVDAMSPREALDRIETWRARLIEESSDRSARRSRPAS